jgi:hypothetical protein
MWRVWLKRYDIIIRDKTELVLYNILFYIVAGPMENIEISHPHPPPQASQIIQTTNRSSDT